MKVKPFRALRPRADLAPRVASPPYDVVSSVEARKLAADNPYSFLHVIKPEIDLEPDADPYDDRVYARGRDNLRAMIEQGWMVRDEQPAFYVYRLTRGEHTQTGIVGVAAVQDYLDNRIRKHEHTRPEKERDRIRLNEALAANPGPVFLTYRGLPELNAIVSGAVAAAPAVAFEAAGVGHTLWPIADPSVCARIETLFGEVRQSYVADGHHRAAAAAAVSARTATAGYFLAAHFPADQLVVLDYNRVVSDLNGLTPQSFLDRLPAAGFHVRAGHRARRPPHRGTFGMYLAGEWYLLTARAEMVPADDCVRGLDISVLDDHLLDPVLGIGDPRTDRRIDFVGGSRGMDELQRRVDSGDAAVAFALFPTALEDVMKVADRGAVMPPKSTWFEPKLYSGLVVQLLDGDGL